VALVDVAGRVAQLGEFILEDIGKPLQEDEGQDVVL
jgi:hypothetical protein